MEKNGRAARTSAMSWWALLCMGVVVSCAPCRKKPSQRVVSRRAPHCFLLPLPFTPFSRTISLYASADWAGDVPLDMAATMRGLMQNHLIEPALSQLPWLGGSLKTFDA